MKEHLILFSTPMVQALLEGRKSQTRRVVKFGDKDTKSIQRATSLEWDMRRADDRMPLFDTWGPQKAHFLFKQPSKYNNSDIVFALQCPYGQVGDRLWVRETWAVFQLESEGGHKEFPNILYRADNSTKLLVNQVVWKYNTPKLKWRPSIFMPRWASRITLEITDIKVQRLWEITEEDAIAEGVLSEEGIKYWNEHPLSFATKTSPKDEYARLWDNLNIKKYPWYLNPWVWVIEFKRI